MAETNLESFLEKVIVPWLKLKSTFCMNESDRSLKCPKSKPIF